MRSGEALYSQYYIPSFTLGNSTRHVFLEDNFGSVTEFAYLRQTIDANMRTEGRLVSFPSFSLSHSKILVKFARGTGILTTRMCLCRG